MSRPLIAVVVIGSVVMIAGMASTLYWILNPDASDAYLYAAPLAGVCIVVLAALAGLVVAVRQRRR